MYWRRVPPRVGPDGGIITSESVADAEAPCEICETSRLPTHACCIGIDGQFRIKVPKLASGSPPRNYANPKCYLHGTNDCTQKPSREHYMSQGILKLFGTKFVAAGLPGIPKGETRVRGLNSMGAYILCTHHNSSLGKLDGFAIRFFEALYRIHLESQSESEIDDIAGSWHSGEALERWMVKLALGHFFSRHALKRDGSQLDDHEIDMQRAEKALLEGVFDKGCGFYVRPSNLHLPSPEAYALAPLTSTKSKIFAGCGLQISGFEMMIDFDPREAYREQWVADGWAHRPSELVFQFGRRTRVLRLTWPIGTPSRSLTVGPTRDTKPLFDRPTPPPPDESA